MSTRILIRTIVYSIITLICGIVFFNYLSADSFEQAAIPTPTPLSEVSYENLVSVHKEVLESIQYNTTFFMALVTGSGAVGALLIYFLIQRSLSYFDKKVSDTQDAMKVLNTRTEESEKKVAEIEMDYGRLKKQIHGQAKIVNSMTMKAKDLLLKLETGYDQMSELDIITQELAEKAAKFEQNLTQQYEQMRELENNIKEIKPSITKSKTIDDIERYAALVLSARSPQQPKLLLTLIQYTYDPDPVIVRRCIRALENILSYPDKVNNINSITSRLREMAGDDKIPASIRLEAKRVVTKFRDIFHKVTTPK